MPFSPLLHSFDEDDLHVMHEAYLRLCEALGIRMSENDDPARLRVAQTVINLAQWGAKPGELQGLALARLRD